LNAYDQGAQQRHQPLGAIRAVHLIVGVHPGLYHGGPGTASSPHGFAWVGGLH
jgi:hypothetical protein